MGIDRPGGTDTRTENVEKSPTKDHPPAPPPDRPGSPGQPSRLESLRAAREAQEARRAESGLGRSKEQKAGSEQHDERGGEAAGSGSGESSGKNTEATEPAPPDERGEPPNLTDSDEPGPEADTEPSGDGRSGESRLVPPETDAPRPDAPTEQRVGEDEPEAAGASQPDVHVPDSEDGDALQSPFSEETVQAESATSGESAREREQASEHGRPEHWLDQPNRPPKLETTRPYDKPGGLTRPDTQHQRDIEDSVPKTADGSPQTFPDPRDRWSQLVNDGGPSADPLRGNNCLDCSLSLMSTWHGEPVVSAPRFPDRKPDGTLDQWTGESGGLKRAERWLDHEYENMGPPAQGFQSIEDKLRAGGHGSSANIVNSWRHGGAHAWNAVNYNDEVLWVDTQTSKVDQKPLYDTANINGVWAIVIDKEGNKL